MTWKITGGVANQPNTPKVEFGFGRNDGWFEARIVEDGERLINATSSGEVTEQDRVVEQFDSGEFGKKFVIEVDIFPRFGGDGDVPSVSISSNGGVRKVVGSDFELETEDGGDGITETVTLTTPQRTLQLSVTGKTRTTGDTTTEFLRFADGTLAKHCEDAVNSRIAGATTSMWPMFADYQASNASGSYTWNPDCWIYDLRQQATCISPWNSNSGNRRAATAITPRHFITVPHFPVPVGSELRFVTADNQTVTRTVVGTKKPPGYSPYFPEVMVGVLDADLPESIVPCKVLPDDWANYLPNGPSFIAAFATDQDANALVKDIDTFDNWANFRQSNNQSDERVLHQRLVSGDSGNPSFIFINGEFVCLTMWLYGGDTGSGTFLTPQIASMNQMIADLDTAAGIDTGYTIQTADLSGFTDFS